MNADEARTAGFEVEANEETALQRTSGVQLVGRESALIQSAYVMALRNPRSEADAYTRIIKACERPGFAEEVRYTFPRGGAQIEGPSVKLAREAARCWGNVRYGFTITEATEDRTTLEGWALDLETNTQVSASASFRNLVQRKQKGTGETRWVTPDERDYRELVNKHAAVAIRNAILQLLPPDVIEDALRKAKETLTKAARGEIKQDRAATLRRLALAFSDYAVSADMIAVRLGHPLDLITEEELVDLRAIFTALKDGISRREEYFDVPAGGRSSPPAAPDPHAAEKEQLRAAGKALGLTDGQIEAEIGKTPAEHFGSLLTEWKAGTKADKPAAKTTRRPLAAVPAEAPAAAPGLDLSGI